MFKKSICQILILVFFFFYNFSNSAFGKTLNLCEGNFDMLPYEVISDLRPNLIEIEVDKYRNWQKNNLKIHTSDNPNILQKFKKKFNSKIIVHFDQKVKCNFKAKIRQSGDHKDHIKFLNGNFFQSVDVELDSGNIKGITKFKLLIPETRGISNMNYEDEILITEIYRKLGFISPRTFLVDVSLNENLSLMMFQEKSEKEMIEFHSRREGPILEGDEKYKFTWYEENKNLFIDISKDYEKLIIKNISKLDGGLAKQTNVNWAIKSQKHLDISEKALTKLNKIYLKYLNQNQYNFIYNYSLHHLDNMLLANGHKDQAIELDVFTAISLSTSRGHGLRPHNRKFYWNSISEYFEPIYYDGNIMLDSVLPHMKIPFYSISSEGIEIAKNRLKKINVEELFEETKLLGSSYTQEIIQKKLVNVLQNLDNLNKSRLSNKNKDYAILQLPKNYDFTQKHLNLNDEELNFYQNKTEHRIFLSKKNIDLTEKDWKNYIKLHFNTVPNLKLILNNEKKKNYFECIKNDAELNCNKINFNFKDLKKLLSGKLDDKNNIFQYIGKFDSLNILEIKEKLDYDKIKIKNTNFFFEKDIKYNLDEANNNLNIFQNKPGAKSFFKDGSIDNLNINFFGYDKKIDSDISNYPFDIRGLTGCLSFINLSLKNISINSSSSTCEDSINFINVRGHIKNINIKKSLSDGLDMDFSNVQVDNINISSSKNDCVDVSYGKYNLNKLKLIDCGDKSLSVGEKSVLNLNEIYSKNTKIGLASKDSSKSFIKSIEFINLKTCLAAYNKKQEFFGGTINVQKMKCVKFDKKFDIDNQSLIVLKNEF